MIGLLFTFLGCGVGEFEDISGAIGAWDQGQAHMKAGELELAEAAFGEAMVLDPESPGLWGWRVKVRQDMGDEAGALALAEAGVRAHPRHMPLRHLRAVLRLQAGDLAGGASDVRRMEETGWLDPLDAGVDPDLSLLRAHTEYAMLVPMLPLEATSHGPDGAVLLGDRVDVELMLVGPPPERLYVQSEATGLLALEAIVETVTQRSPHVQQRILRLEYRAVAPGRSSLGPWAISVGERTTHASAIEVEIKAVGQRRQTAAAWEPPLVLPSVWAREPISGQPEQVGARLELREGGVLRWEGVRGRKIRSP